MWGPMDRRSIRINVDVSGQPISSIKASLVQYYADHTEQKVLVYTNSKKAADGSLYEMADKIVDNLNAREDVNLKNEVLCLTGDCGIMMKTYLMESFCNDCDLGNDNDISPNIDGEDDTKLPYVSIMPCTSAAQCGISSKRCSRAYRYGPPPNMNDLVQEMGRVDRSHNAAPGDHGYFVHMNFDTYINLFIRTQCECNPIVRKRLEEELHQVLNFLILPSKCYHVRLEEFLENPITYKEREPCGHLCPFCTDNYKTFSNAVNRDVLLKLLRAKIFLKGSIPADTFVTFLNDKQNQHTLKERIWGKGSKSLPTGKIHGLVLMMFASGAVKLSVRDKKRIGKDFVRMKDVDVSLGTCTVPGDDGDEMEDLVMLQETTFSQFTFK